MIKKDTKVAVLGAGAMGCLFGGLLAEKGLDVVLIDVWKEHVNEINGGKVPSVTIANLLVSFEEKLPIPMAA